MPTSARSRRSRSTAATSSTKSSARKGDFIALTPGGRFSKDIPGLRPLALALVKGGYRVLLWDRPNCGKSDVQFWGRSESHMRAETLQQLITKLDIGPCIIAGGSGGARDSMLTTMLYPELVTKLVVWNIVGGVYGSFVLGCALHHAEHPRGPRTRHQGPAARCANGGTASRRIPTTNNGSSHLDTDEFLKVMLRWLNAFVSKPGQTIPGVEDEMFDEIKVPTLIIRGGENDWDHPKRTSLEVSCLIKGSKLIDPPWPEDAWERAGEARASGKVKRFNMFDTWVQAAPPILDFLGSDADSLDDDVDLAVERGLQRGVHTALRHPLQVGLAQRHAHRVPSGPSTPLGVLVDLARQAKPSQHPVRVVVGAATDVGHHPGDRCRPEGLAAQVDRQRVSS